MAEHAWSDLEKQEALSTGEMEPARVLANGKQQAVENIWGGSSLAGPAQGDVNVGLLPLSAVLSWDGTLDSSVSRTCRQLVVCAAVGQQCPPPRTAPTHPHQTCFVCVKSCFHHSNLMQFDSSLFRENLDRRIQWIRDS
jgi:hypothetical protein